LADHDLDGDGVTQISLFSGRGILSESAGPVWMIGTASEHHTLYEYSLIGAKNHWMGFIQTETVSIIPLCNQWTPLIINALAPRSLTTNLFLFLRHPLKAVKSGMTRSLVVISTQPGASMYKKAQTSQSSVPLSPISFKIY